MKNSDLELSDIACRADSPYQVAAERMNTEHYPNRVILIFSPPTHEQNYVIKKGNGNKLAMPKVFHYIWT